MLAKLVDGARASLGDNFCGGYLHGSFATRDADEFSDVDFVIVSHEELTADQQHNLQLLHGRLYAIQSPWAQHLEGSYVPGQQLRRLDWTQQPFFYLDNGAKELVWDTHCNTAVVRWLLREHGVVLAGPDPKLLIDPVSASDLQREALARAQEYADWARTPTEVGTISRWKQTYLVLTFCRLLFTLFHRRIASKREAGEWAVGALDGEWARLVRQALEDRADPWTRVFQPADRDLAARTIEFAHYAVAVVAEWAAGQ